MKKFATIFGFLFLIFVLTSCQAGADTASDPEEGNNETSSVEDNQSSDSVSKVPDLTDVEEESAKQAIAALGFIPVIEMEYNPRTETGKVIKTEPIANAELEKGNRITIYISKGPALVMAQDSTISWYNIYGSTGDEWEFYAPYIEEGMLNIECEVTFNSSYSMEWKGEGFGIASVRDTFDKTVPVRIHHESKEIIKGEKQNFTLVIPLADLDVIQPTTIYTELVLLVDGDDEFIMVEFSISW